MKRVPLEVVSKLKGTSQDSSKIGFFDGSDCPLKVWGLVQALLTCVMLCSSTTLAAQPNILWLTTEDIGPHLGCYGDKYADTPHLDAFAKKSLLYLNAWSTAPVCAPARTTLISGLYPPCTGSEHMRSMTQLPENIEMYPTLLREAGYFCVNPGKEDYNLEKRGQVWDTVNNQKLFSELTQHQPFMAVLNYTGTHESKIRSKPHDLIHDPSKARVPAHHPDVPEVRRDWAQYYDNITVMDAWFQKQLDGLKEQGLADNTIVMFYGDHGSGMPRHKRWPYNSGLRVPFIIHVPAALKEHAPAEYQAGGTSDRLMGFIDMAATLCSLAGKQPPAYLQGNAIMGAYETKPPQYAFGFRGRMDERYDMVRTVRNQRYIYIRNYMPHKVYGQYINYMFQTTTTQKWKELFDAGKLNDAQSLFWRTKPYEELYDLQTDPDEVVNLASSSEHQDVLNELRKAHEAWVFRVRDVGFLPEDELHNRAPDLTPYEFGHSDAYHLREIYAVATAAASLDYEQTPYLTQMLDAEDSAVRYWAAMGLLMRGANVVATVEKELRKVAKSDASPSVRVIAAEALGRYGDESSINLANKTLIECANGENHGIYVAMLALNALDAMDDNARSVRNQIEKLPTKGDWTFGRGNAYVPNLITKTLDDLK